jgi:cytochrome c oxidase cbb3-type subunit 3
VKAPRFLCVSALVSLTILTGCGLPSGQPRQGSEALAPKDVVDFDTLYAGNCAACHGPDGKGGAAIALGNPVYLAIADDAGIRAIIANGVRGTSMPAFSQHAGGMLTDAQIDVIAREIRARWCRPAILDGTRLQQADV